MVRVAGRNVDVCRRLRVTEPGDARALEQQVGLTVRARLACTSLSLAWVDGSNGGMMSLPQPAASMAASAARGNHRVTSGVGMSPFRERSRMLCDEFVTRSRTSGQ